MALLRRLPSSALETIGAGLPAPAGFGRVLILKGEPFYGEALGRSVRQVFPAAVIQVISHLRDARIFLAATRVDLLVVGLALLDGDALHLLDPGAHREPRFRRVLVVTGRKEPRLLSLLRSLPIDGVFDPTSEGVDQFERALSTLAAGRSHWSPDVLECLRQQPAPARVCCRPSGGLPTKRAAVSPAGHRP